jgi:hypothetical protein
MPPFPYDNARYLLPALMVSATFLMMPAPSAAAQVDAMYLAAPRATITPPGSVPKAKVAVGTPSRPRR